MSVRSDIRRILDGMGFHEEAARLTEAGSAGYPEEPAFVAGAALIAGRLEVVTMEQVVLAYGQGPCKLRIRNTISYDGAGHGSPHFEIVYMQEVAGGATEAQGSATSELHSIYEELPGKKTAAAL